MIESSLVITSASTLNTHRCIPLGPTDLCVPSSPRLSLTRSSSIKEKSYVPQILPLISGIPEGQSLLLRLPHICSAPRRKHFGHGVGGPEGRYSLPTKVGEYSVFMVRKKMGRSKRTVGKSQITTMGEKKGRMKKPTLHEGCMKHCCPGWSLLSSMAPVRGYHWDVSVLPA